MLGSTTLCTTINAAIALAFVDLWSTAALVLLALPTTAGAMLAAYVWHDPLSVVFGALVGFGTIPLILSKRKTTNDDADAPASA